MNPFTKRIGIWYNTKEEKEKVFNVLFKMFKEDSNVNRILNSINETFIEFKNGDTIKSVPLNESSRGNRFSESFIINPEPTVDYIKKIQLVIVKTIISCGEVYIIDDLENEQIIEYQFMYRYNYREWLVEYKFNNNNKLYCYAKPNTMTGHIFTDDVAICESKSKEDACDKFRKMYDISKDEECFVKEVKYNSNDIYVATDY